MGGKQQAKRKTIVIVVRNLEGHSFHPFLPLVPRLNCTRRQRNRWSRVAAEPSRALQRRPSRQNLDRALVAHLVKQFPNFRA